MHSSIGRTVLLAVTVVLPALAASAALADDKEITLVRSYKAGDSERMKIVISFQMGGIEGTITEIARTVVKEVKKNGDVVTIDTAESAHISVAGQEQDAPPEPPATSTRDKSGRLIDFKTEIGEASPFTAETARLVALGSEAILSDKPVKPGATWETTFDNPVVKDKKIVVKTEFVGVVTVDKTDLWQLRQSGTADVEGDTGKTTFKQLMWLDPKTGHTVKIEGNTKDLPTKMGTMSWTIQASILKADDKKATDTPPAKP